jgi:hypothetical protein
MQVRKLIRLLNELVEKDPSLKYSKVCIDTEFGKSNAPYFKYYEIPDVEIRYCVWNPEETENMNERRVVVLGNY